MLCSRLRGANLESVTLFTCSRARYNTMPASNQRGISGARLLDVAVPHMNVTRRCRRRPRLVHRAAQTKNRVPVRERGRSQANAQRGKEIIARVSERCRQVIRLLRRRVGAMIGFAQELRYAPAKNPVVRGDQTLFEGGGALDDFCRRSRVKRLAEGNGSISNPQELPRHGIRDKHRSTPALHQRV